MAFNLEKRFILIQGFDFKKWLIYYLVNNRFDRAIVQYSFNLLAVEVGETYGLCKAEICDMLHSFPGLNEIDIRVDKFPVRIFRESLRIFLDDKTK